ncbi:hypothetical protein QJS10_CPB04g01380 [Acorus calamus]|uniref:Uncharacterized protein n=1 Tax=Acorus calamus TaxID=4465 RepID=A0AAV9F1X5_ACOCL|nr:hypothetical protein QJS10_CPB04g01380 [Acorus calamus]
MARSSNTDAMETDGGNASLSITIERNPPESRLLELGIKSWPKQRARRGLFTISGHMRSQDGLETRA